MLAHNVVMIAVTAGVGLIVFQPRLMRSPTWRATITPLASIIGSGFLVVGPILAHTVGNWAWLAMSGLCAVAYLFGFAVRRNILFVEPMLANGAPHAVTILERASDLALSFAYFVSVAYYLNLFASFALRGLGIIDPEQTRILSSAAIVTIAGFGVYRGLRSLETIEEVAVGAKLSLIAGVVAAMALSAIMTITKGAIVLTPVPHETGLHEFQILLGLIILVQGFETSRYLGANYDRDMRVKTMRHAQWLSSAIYLVFIVLLTPFFRGTLPSQGGETAIIDMLSPIGFLVTPMIIVMAIASQLSAAVADMNGAGGMLVGATSQKISAPTGYILTAVAALFFTWSANVFAIIVYASKAFVIYYGLQCGLAALVAMLPGDQHSRLSAVICTVGIFIAGLVLFYGIPADA
jgi:hypothetical protein